MSRLEHLGGPFRSSFHLGIGKIINGEIDAVMLRLQRAGKTLSGQYHSVLVSDLCVYYVCEARLELMWR